MERIRMVTFKKMSQLSIEDLTKIWNQGFEGYYINLSMDINRFLTRAVNDGLTLEHSLVMYEGDEAIGFVMNGIRTVNGQKVAWNGGTGISTEYRGRGFGRLLMEHNLTLYREQGANIALLEAFLQNERAIKLYQHVGYEITEHLISLQLTEALPDSLLLTEEPNRYTVRFGLPVKLRQLPFNRTLAAWQSQWQAIKDGECAIVSEGDAPIGYVLFKRMYGEDGHIEGIAIYQCEVEAGREDKEQIMKLALREAYQPLEAPIKRYAIFIRDTNPELLALLKSLGFTPYIELVHMKQMIT